MPGFNSSPIAILNQIKSNLQDRYATGFPILKELLQNADDSQADQICLDAVSGWPDAINPLLRGPGLLAINDGTFREEDQEGFITFGESRKATDTAAIGKFGFGQKAVFHLCDAFIVCAESSGSSYQTVVNPFLNFDTPGNVTKEWDSIGEADIARLLAVVTPEINKQRLILWIPFRRDDLAPAPGTELSSNRPTSSQIMDELARPEELQTILASLRHLKRIELRKNGELWLDINFKGRAERMLGPDAWREGVRAFGGTLVSKSHSTPAVRSDFVGREAMILDARFERLRKTPHWPKTISVLRSQPEPEKGEPHGAAILLRVPDAKSSDLTLSWAVFLPISDANDIGISLGNVGLGHFRVLLHGYYFLDSGRKHIDGLKGLVTNDDPSDAAGLRQAWNAALRDTVTLPLLPGLLRSALDKKIVTSDELSTLVAAIAGNDWFKQNRAAVCRTDVLVRVSESTNGTVWRTKGPASKFRPLPKAILDVPKQLTELFPSIYEWASAQDIILCVDESASLLQEPIRWLPEEIASLLSETSPRAFQSGSLASLLMDFLSLAGSDESIRQSAGSHLVSALRKAMQDQSPLASAEKLSAILAFVPSTLLFRLPPSVEHRQVLRAMALTKSQVLPVRGAWLGENHCSPRLSDGDLEALLGALEPLIDGNNADEAAPAALAMLYSAEHKLEALVRNPNFATKKVLRARNVRSEKVLAMSLQILLDASRAGLLFGVTPAERNRLLPLLVNAISETDPLIVEGRTAEFLRGKEESTLSLLSANKKTVLSVISKASGFGAEGARSLLLTQLQPSEEDDRGALRGLCAGAAKAMAQDATLWVLDQAPGDLERLIKNILSQSDREFLVPAQIASELNMKMRSQLGIQPFDTPGLEALFNKNAELILESQLTDSEREALLLTDLSDTLLRRLPIHHRSDGSFGSSDNLFMEADWEVPTSLHQHVLTARQSKNAKALKRQKSLVTAWSPQAQIDTALAFEKPHIFQKDILDALAEIFDLNGDLSKNLTRLLREKPWLVVGDIPVAAQDVLTLPQLVNQAARAVLLQADTPPTFFTVDQLPNDVRLHRACNELEKHILLDQRSSFEALGLMIDEGRLIGRLGGGKEDEGFPLEDYTFLAKAGVDLALPGWSLLAALLIATHEDQDQSHNIIMSFAQVQDPAQAAHHLDALSMLANQKGQIGEAALRAYRHGFDTVIAWPNELRQRVFGGTRVPNEAGEWRSGGEVLEDGNGISPMHVLSREFASKLRKHQDGNAHRLVKDSDSSNSRPEMYSHPSDMKPVDLAKIEAQCAAQLGTFLEPWRGHVPSDLVIIFLGFIGRFPALRKLAGEWVSDATKDVETLWEDLDQCLNPTLHANPLPREVDERRFLIEQVDEGHHRGIAMSGDIIDAPLGDGFDGIIVGNLHKGMQGIRSSDGVGRLLITLPLRTLEVGAFVQTEASLIFRRFVETIATDCLMLGMTDQQNAVGEVLDKAADVDQITLEETECLLRDMLPTILAEMKLATSSQAQQALREFQKDQGKMIRLPPKAGEGDKLKNKLWEKIQEPIISVELLTAVRAKIKELGYSSSRVLFELFQNADDAYQQLDDMTDKALFRVEILSDNRHGFRVVHWGRPINHLGADPDEGYRRGHNLDLFNMLLMNFSEKRAEEDLTGKFGLGFKSVHVLSDSVGIASGFISLRTRGGFLPELWHDGLDEVARRRQGAGRKATVIDVPFAPEMTIEGEDAINTFKTSMALLPVFSRRIRRIELVGEDPASVECKTSLLLNDQKIHIVELQEVITQRALQLDLGKHFCLLLKIDRVGPTNFPEDLRRIWNLAPLEESLQSGWLLNGPFAVVSSRGRLAGLIGDRQEVFKLRGRPLGERLVSLYDLAEGDWKGFAKELDLNSSCNDGQILFWSQLFDVFCLDLDDDLAKYLHVDGNGYARLVAEREVVPTRLPWPFDGLVRASDVDYFIGGALTEHAVLEKLQTWTSLQAFKGSIVAPEVADPLEKLGFKLEGQVTLATLLQQEMGKENRIDTEVASRLGKVITPETIENDPMRSERYEILEVVKQSHFRAQDGTWRPVKDLSSVRCGNQDEKMRCEFAPESALLHESYSDIGVEFFHVARAQSGYGPQASLLIKWAAAVSNIEKQRAVLLYIMSGDQRSGLSQEMRRAMPPWIPQPIEGLLSNVLLNGWSEEDKKKLLLELGGGHLLSIFPVSPIQPETEAEPEEVLKAIHAWWEREKESEREEYTSRLYPEFFDPSNLRDSDDRVAWFTMFALACFRSIGRTQDGQHRSYLEQGWREGWWQELASSHPPHNVQAWLDRLEGWSSPTAIDQSFMPWRRAFVDLYTVARGLDDYAELIRKIPRFVEHHGPIALNNILQPSYSPIVAPLGIDASPINRSLGIGVNWMIRELQRGGVYKAEDEGLVAPYCWASTGRVREQLLSRISPIEWYTADKDASRGIYEFIKNEVGEELARFDGDFDLPLQIITRKEHHDALADCMSEAGIKLDSYSDISDEYDEFEDEVVGL